MLGRKSLVVGALTSVGLVVADATGASAAEVADPVGYVPKWAPFTQYAGGRQVISPNNDVVSAKVAHRSSAAYVTDTAKWSLSSTYLTPEVASSTYALLGSSATTPGIAAFVRKMQTGADAVILAAVGDSTGSMVGGWLNGLVETKIANQFPAYTITERLWLEPNQYWPTVPTTVQTGTAGPRRFVSTGSSTDRFFTIADSPATSPTGDLDVRCKLMVPAAAAFTLAGKYDTVSNNRGWFVSMDGTGKLSLFYSTDGTGGTQLTRTSTVAVPGAAFGVPAWFRVTRNATSGDTNFYYSLDGTTWVQIGMTAAGSPGGIFDAAAPAATQFQSRTGNGNSTGVAVEYYRLMVFSNLAGLAPCIDLDTALWNGYGSSGSTAAFTDYCGNPVVIGGTGQGGAMVGAPILAFLNGCVSGQVIAYANDSTRFPKLTPIPADLFVINFGYNEGGNIGYRVAFKQLADAVIAKWPDVGVIAVKQARTFSPAVNITEHAIRGDQIATLAAGQGYALIDAYGILAKTGQAVNYIRADGVHPTVITDTLPQGFVPGADLIRDGAWQLFKTVL